MLFARMVGEGPDVWETTAMFGIAGDDDMDDLDLAEYGKTIEESLGRAVLALETASQKDTKAT